MHSEAGRLQTFTNWPIESIISHYQIAEAGFYYTGQAQIVQCFLCGTTISEWNFNDQPMIRHRLANPQCPFILEPLHTCNIPLRVDFSSSSEEDFSDGDDSNDIAEGRIPCLRQTGFKNYFERLRTFENWPVPDIVLPETLARSGFYYLNQEDLVQCVYCNGTLSKWTPGDCPDEEHRKQFPNCDFYLREEHEENDLSTEKVDFGNVKLMPGTTSNLTELGIQNHLAPRQPKHTTFEGRLHTFQGWPTDLNQTPEMLADAGFYYLGSRDQVRCFHCGGGLRNWEENDNAWVEHARWFPKCGYVVLVKGQEFIKQCIDNKQPSDPSLVSNTPCVENVDVSITPSVSPTIVSPERPIRRVTDTELERLLGTPPAVAALEIGLHVGRIKMALKRRMEQTGVPYANADQLIEDATQIQLREEDNITSNQTPSSPSSELTHLLNQIICTAESANSSTVSNRNTQDIKRKQSNAEEQKISKCSVDTETDKMQGEEQKTKTEETVSLMEENRRLKEARLCKICMDKEFAVVFLPCSHLLTCVFCASSLTHCPMCRQEIRATVRTFLV